MKRIATAALAAAAALALAACSSSPATETGGATGAAAEGGKTLGIVAYIGNNAINQQAIRGAETVADANGWDVKITDTQGNADQANAAMTSYATQGVDGILVLVYAATAVGAGLQSASAAGVPVAIWGGGLADGVIATTSNESVGAASAEALVDTMGTEGDILALTFHPGKLCLDHGEEFDAAVADTDLKVTYNEVVVPGQQTSASNFTTTWLASHPAGAGNYGIWTCWDEPMDGVISALAQAGRTDVKTFSTNGSAPGILDVKDGTLTSVVWQPSEDEGAALMQAIVDYTADPSGWEPKTIKIDGVVVDAGNVDDFIAEHPDAVK
jgi:ribose transport system substrate-binding protein